MRILIRSALTSFAVGGMLIAASPSYAVEYPWCAQYSQILSPAGRVAMIASPLRSDSGPPVILAEDGNGSRNCGFMTREQCMAALSGTGGSCERNLFYRGELDRPAEGPPRRHRH